MKNISISLIIFFIISCSAFSQEKILEKIELSFSAGLAIPVGNFSAISVAPSLEPVPPV